MNRTTTGLQVVLIEDNPADVLLIEMALRKSSVVCEITQFQNGQEALKALCPPERPESKGFVPDAILLDLNTPKSDGFDVLNQLKNTPYLAGVPIAIITSSQAASDKARSYSLGATRYLQKPSDLKEFLANVGQAVKEMIGTRAALPMSRSV